MTKEEVLPALKEILSVIRPSADLSAVSYDSQLTRDLGIDSLSMLLMSMAIETKFSITFENSAPFVTVNDVCEYVISHVKE